MARRVFHTKDVWPLKDDNAYLTKSPTLVKEQCEEQVSNLRQAEFLKPYERNACFKAAFYFRAKMNAQQRALRAALVPLFTIPDMSVKTRLLVDTILGEYEA